MLISSPFPHTTKSELKGNLASIKKMASLSWSNNASDENSRIEPHFPNPNEISMYNNVGESSSSPLFLRKAKRDNRQKRAYLKRNIKKVKCPLPPPRKPKSTSAPEPSRASLSLDMAIEYELIHGRQLDPNLDSKGVRRTISNRISAQRSRLKRLQYVTDLENRVQELEKSVLSLNPKLEDFNEKRRILEIENVSLRTQVDIRAAESRISEDRLEEKRRELMELKKLQKHMQQLQMNVLEADEMQLQMNNIIPELDMHVSQLYMNIVPEFEMQIPAEVEMMQVSASNVRPKPYSIEFYQERLMQMEMNQFIDQELKNLALALPPPQPDDDLFMELAIGDDNDLEIDQYLNLDEIDLLHPNDV